MMKTYLTNKEFVDLVFKTYEQKMTVNYQSELSDNILYRMFKEYQKEFKETLEGSMWNIDELENTYPVIEFIGPQFHKSFRQTDVIPAKHIDMIVWSCMREAPVFWKCLEKACKILVSEDASKIYKDD